MKKWSLPVAMACLLLVTTACAQGVLTATLEGTVVKGSYTAQEALEGAHVAITGETDTARYALLDVAQLEPLSAGETGTFAVDLATASETASITDLATQQTEALAALTPEQREALLAGKLRVSLYRGDAPTADALLVACDVAAAAAMTVGSAGIHNGVLGDEYGKKGEQKRKGIPTLSMPLSLENLPAGTQALAVYMTDPDGGDWTHWLAANIAPTAEIPQNASIDLAAQMVQGINSFGFTGYGGPTPPSGTHTYVITVFALAEPLALKDGFTLKAFQKALDGKVLAQASLTGDYSR